MSLKVKHEIWKANKSRTSAELVEQFVSQGAMNKFLEKHVKCPKNKDNFNNGWHEWNDCVLIKGVEGVRSVCDFCGLMIVDVPWQTNTPSSTTTTQESQSK